MFDHVIKNKLKNNLLIYFLVLLKQKETNLTNKKVE